MYAQMIFRQVKSVYQKGNVFDGQVVNIGSVLKGVLVVSTHSKKESHIFIKMKSTSLNEMFST